jgi:hypothetical protein
MIGQIFLFLLLVLLFQIEVELTSKIKEILSKEFIQNETGCHSKVPKLVEAI